MLLRRVIDRSGLRSKQVLSVPEAKVEHRGLEWWPQSDQVGGEARRGLAVGLTLMDSM